MNQLLLFWSRAVLPPVHFISDSGPITQTGKLLAHTTIKAAVVDVL